MIQVLIFELFRLDSNEVSLQPIKTKSEISGLRDFVEWLEEVKGNAKDGIILVFHEQLQTCPALLLHCLGEVFFLSLVNY